MRRRIVEIPRHEVGRFRREAVQAEQAAVKRLLASLGERVIEKQAQRAEQERGEKQA